MKRVAAIALALAAASICSGATKAAPTQVRKQLVPFAWYLEGQTQAPLRQSVVRLIRTRDQVKRVKDELAPYTIDGDFRDYAALAVFYAGDHPAVHVTRLIRAGSQLSVYLAVSPPSRSAPSSGSYNVVLIPKRLVAGVDTVTVVDVEERPLAPVAHAEPVAEPVVTIRATPHPRPGKFFTAAVATFAHPSSYVVAYIRCRGTIGGHWTQAGEFRSLVGGKPLRAIIRRSYTAGGFLRGFSCGWWIPKSARGKLLALEGNNCYDACETGLMYTVFLLGGDHARSGVSNAWSGVSWRVRR